MRHQRLVGSGLLGGMRWCANNHESVVFVWRTPNGLEGQILTMRG